MQTENNSIVTCYSERMKLLIGKDVAAYIKPRHAKQVRALNGAGIKPCLAIVQTKKDPTIERYVTYKHLYGDEIGAEVVEKFVEQDTVREVISGLNEDASVHGIIVQLPLANMEQVEQILACIKPAKDVDDLTSTGTYPSATPTAILWLLAAYNVEYETKKMLIVGNGRLVGAPLFKMLRDSVGDLRVVDEHVEDLANEVAQAQVVVTATGVPGLIVSEMVSPGTVLVDAGVSTDGGVQLGDLANDIYERTDITVTPKIGGVGPLTICALFENVLRAAGGATDNQ